MTKNTLRTAEKTPSPTPSQPLTVEARPVQQQRRRNPPIAGELAAIALAQQGDGASFEVLYNMHKRRVYSLCLRMLGNVAEAEDLTQEAFLQLHRKIATFRGDSAFSTWLHRMA
ncbi:MAG: RNA polymerase sigma factor, partial [Acidobacteriaceae bacterium]